MFASCHSDLIYDIGMHVGDDTDFYLRKGFRVVAIEANPELAAKAAERFAGAIAESRLSVLNVAVAGYNGLIELLITPEKDDWSTVVPEVAKKKEAESGASFTAIEVGAIRFEPILARFGVPYYMKLDIEGAERHCLEALAGFSARPKFISIELGALNALDSLSSLGYSQFKIINQRLNESIVLPRPPREGQDVEWRFDSLFSSGAFGEETAGTWLPTEKAADQLRRVLATWETGDWYDIHAKLSPPAPARTSD